VAKGRKDGGLIKCSDEFSGALKCGEFMELLGNC